MFRGVKRMTKQINKNPKPKPPHDLSIRLGTKKALKGKLQKIAGKNQISLNRLLIFIIEEFIREYAIGKKFTRELK